MTAGPPAADSVAGQQTQTFHISTAATAVDISQLAIYLQSYYKEVEATFLIAPFATERLFALFRLQEAALQVSLSLPKRREFRSPGFVGD